MAAPQLRLSDTSNPTGSSPRGQTTAQPGRATASRITSGSGPTAPAPSAPSAPLQITPNPYAPGGNGAGGYSPVQVPGIFSASLQDTERLFAQAAEELAAREQRERDLLAGLPGRYASETDWARNDLRASTQAIADTVGQGGPGAAYGVPGGLLPIVEAPFMRALEGNLQSAQQMVPVLQAGALNAAAERKAMLDSARINELNAIRLRQAELEAQIAMENARLAQANQQNNGIFGSREINPDRVKNLTDEEYSRAKAYMPHIEKDYNQVRDQIAAEYAAAQEAPDEKELHLRALARLRQIHGKDPARAIALSVWMADRGFGYES